MSVNEIKCKAFSDAYKRLAEAVAQEKEPGIIGDLIRDGIIQRFEFTLEMAWKFLRVVLLDKGIMREDVASPRKVVRSAFANGLIKDGDVWLEMLRYRNTILRVYNEQEAVELEHKIKTIYIVELRQACLN